MPAMTPYKGTQSFENLISNNRLGNQDCCWLCNAPNNGIVRFEDHHIVPRHLGGENGPLVFLCSSCHTNVHVVAEDWYKTREFYSMYSNPVHTIRLRWLSGVICTAREELEKSGKDIQNKNFAISGRLDFKTHKKLSELASYMKISQLKVIKLAIDNLYKSLM